jgi:hypothetical protein
MQFASRPRRWGKQGLEPPVTVPAARIVHARP